AQTSAQRRLAHRNREPDLEDHPLRIFDEVQPGEPQHLPAQKCDLVLPLSIMLEGGVIVTSPAVDLDGDLGAASPMPGSHPPGRGRLTYAGTTGLSQREDTVVLTEILVEHLLRAARPPRPVPSQ